MYVCMHVYGCDLPMRVCGHSWIARNQSSERSALMMRLRSRPKNHRREWNEAFYLPKKSLCKISNLFFYDRRSMIRTFSEIRYSAVHCDKSLARLPVRSERFCDFIARLTGDLGETFRKSPSSRKRTLLICLPKLFPPLSNLWGGF